MQMKMVEHFQEYSRQEAVVQNIAETTAEAMATSETKVRSSSTNCCCIVVVLVAVIAAVAAIVGVVINVGGGAATSTSSTTAIVSVVAATVIAGTVTAIAAFSCFLFFSFSSRNSAIFFSP